MMSNPTILNDLIRTRRAIFPRQFDDEPVSLEIIMQLLENANWAPTHKKTEPWRFVVIRGEAKERLGDLMAALYLRDTDPPKFKPTRHKKKAASPRQAACVIAICMQRHEELLPEWEEIAATACAVQNLWLSATAHGLGGYWSSPGIISDPEVRRFLELSETERCLGFFYLGHYDEAPQEGQRGDIADKVRWINS